MGIQTETFAFKGTFYLREWIAGVLSPKMIGPLDADEINVKFTVNRDPRRSFKVENYKQTIGNIVTLEDTEMTLSVNGGDSAVLALVLGGESAVLAITGGTVTGEAVTLIHDTWIKTAQKNISSVAITGGTEGTDFLVSPEIGAIMTLSTGGLADNLATTVDYSYGAIDGIQIAAGSKMDTRYELLGIVENLETASKGELWVPKLGIASESDLNLMAETHQSAKLNGYPELADGQNTTVYFNSQLLYS